MPSGCFRCIAGNNGFAIIHEGFLQYTGRNGIAKTSWWVVDGYAKTMIKYSTRRKQYSKIEKIVLKNSRIKLSEEDLNSLTFTIKTSVKSYSFTTKSKEELDTWMIILQSCARNQDRASLLEYDYALKSSNCLLNGKYSFVKELGRGSSGVVQLYSYLGKPYAIKKMISKKHHLKAFTRKNNIKNNEKEEEEEDELKREIAILKKISDLPGVVRLYEVIQDELNNEIYLVMEYMGGGNLMDYDELTKCFILPGEDHAMDEGTARHYFRQITSTLFALHSNHLCHRDIKPANILISEDKKQCKLADFGIAHMFKEEREKIHRTTSDITNKYLSRQKRVKGLKKEKEIEKIRKSSLESQEINKEEKKEEDFIQQLETNLIQKNKISNLNPVENSVSNNTFISFPNSSNLLKKKLERLGEIQEETQEERLEEIQEDKIEKTQEETQEARLEEIQEDKIEKTQEESQGEIQQESLKEIQQERMENTQEETQQQKLVSTKKDFNEETQKEIIEETQKVALQVIEEVNEKTQKETQSKEKLEEKSISKEKQEKRKKESCLNLISKLELIPKPNSLNENDIKLIIPSRNEVLKENKVRKAKRSSSLDKTNGILYGTNGTYQFMSPESLSGNAYSGYSSDIWSLGITLYCCVIGKLPFYSSDIISLFDAIEHKELSFPSNSKASESLKDLLRKMLEKDPLKRIQLKDIRTHKWLIFGLESTQYRAKLAYSRSRRISINEKDISHAITSLDTKVNIVLNTPEDNLVKTLNQFYPTFTSPVTSSVTTSNSAVTASTSTVSSSTSTSTVTSSNSADTSSTSTVTPSKNLCNKLIKIYKPQPLKTDSIQLEKFLLSNIGILTKQCHYNWCKQKFLDGWQYNELRNDQLKHHPCLLPFWKLNTKEHETNKNLVLSTLKAVIVLGYKIKPLSKKLMEIKKNSSSIVIPGNLLILIELLAENAHENWSFQQINEGWTYGINWDLEKKLHPCLLPFALLTIEQKKENRDSINGILTSLIALQYTIIKQ